MKYNEIAVEGVERVSVMGDDGLDENEYSE